MDGDADPSLFFLCKFLEEFVVLEELENSLNARLFC